MSILTDFIDVSGLNSLAPEPMAAVAERTVDPHTLMDINAVGVALTSNPHIPLEQTQSYAMAAPGIKSGYQMKPPEGSDMQVAHHNRADFDHVMKMNGPYG